MYRSLDVVLLCHSLGSAILFDVEPVSIISWLRSIWQVLSGYWEKRLGFPLETLNLGFEPQASVMLGSPVRNTND